MAALELHECIAQLDAGGIVRIRTSRTKVLGMLGLGVMVGIGLLVLLALFVQQVIRTGEHLPALIHPVTWATVIGVIGCVVLLPLASVAVLLRGDELHLSRAGIAEARRRSSARTTTRRWDEIQHVGTPRTGNAGRFRGPLAVVYTMTPRARHRLEQAHAEAGVRPPRWLSRRQPGTVLVRSEYVLGPKRLARLLTTAQQRYS